MNERANNRTALVPIIAALVLNPPVVGFVFSPDGRMHTSSLIAFVLLGEILLVAGGIIIIAQKLTRRQILFSLLTILIVLCSVEAGLHILVRIVDPAHRVTNRRLLLPIYKDSTWAEQMFDEDAAVRSDYVSYLGWRSDPFNGTWVNVDSLGCRRTVQPFVSPGQTVPRLFVFGGSAAWGIYTRDEHTIPSELSRFLQVRGHPCSVTNQAEKGYTFMQGILRLMLLLQDGKCPDIVVFYDGVNDALNAYRTGKPGELGLSSYLEGLLALHQASQIRQFGMLVRDGITNQLMTYKAFDRLWAIVAGKSGSGFRQRTYDDRSREVATEGTAENYAWAHRMLRLLSREYGFSYVCFLQPAIYTKARLMPEEERTDDLSQDAQARAFLLETYSRINGKGLPNVIDLSAVLDAQPGACYSDFCHVSEASNAIIASAIADTLLARGIFDSAIGSCADR